MICDTTKAEGSPQRHEKRSTMQAKRNIRNEFSTDFFPKNFTVPVSPRSRFRFLSA